MRDLPPIVLGQRVVGETDERKDLISAVHGHALAVWTFDHDVIEATDDIERYRTGATLLPFLGRERGTDHVGHTWQANL